jgi:hypothetical protein
VEKEYQCGIIIDTKFKDKLPGNQHIDYPKTANLIKILQSRPLLKILAGSSRRNGRFSKQMDGYPVKGW